jgi:hypothetical protein
MPRSNASGVRKNRGLGSFGNVVTPDERYLFGTEAELAERVGTNYQSKPSDNPTNFQQIRPGPAGTNINNKQPEGRRGAPKFGSPRRYA